jgi:hypothetical protein
MSKSELNENRPLQNQIGPLGVETGPVPAPGALLHYAELALKPCMDFDASHWVGLAAIHAAQRTAARFLHEHKPHCFVAHRTEWGRRLGLRHVHALIRRERKALSHRWLPMVGGDGTTMELLLDRLLSNIAHTS